MKDLYPRIRHYEASPGGAHLVIRESVRLIFYVPLNHHALAASVGRALDAYLRTAGEGTEALCYYSGSEGEAYPLDETGWDLVWSRLHAGTSRHAIHSVAELDPGAFKRMLKQQCETRIHLFGGGTEANGHAFDYVARIPWPAPSDELSVVSCSFPTEQLEKAGPARTRELAMELASMLPFSSGHAGLAFFLSNRPGSTMQAIREEVFRHPGLDVPDAGVRDTLGARVDGVHWLNFLGPPVVEALGGAGALRARLRSPGTEVRELAGGRVVVTLGEWPEAGDLERGHGLPAYRELARVLEPWLYEPTFPWSDFTQEDMRRWARRFLD
jgi:hypothetical protein